MTPFSDTVSARILRRLARGICQHPRWFFYPQIGLALAGVGLFISSISSTQQQAFLGVFAFMVPAVNLSGYVAPIENMPLLFKVLAYMNPLTYCINIVKGVFLKSYGFQDALPDLWPLFLISFGTLSLALYMFRRHIA